MSEISTPNLGDGLIPSAAQMNTPARVGAADIAHFLQYLLSGDAFFPAPGAVAGGLAVLGKVNDMRVDVLAGAGAIFIGATPSPQHPLNLAILRATTQSPTLNDGDGTHPRIDVVSITPATALLDSELMLLPGGGTQAQFTRRGPGTTIVVTEGTPAASPVAPSTPSGSIKLAEVLVPAGLTAAGGGTDAATITDYRNKLGVATRGPDTAGGYSLSEEDWTTPAKIAMVSLFGARAEFNKLLRLAGDVVEHWPAFTRLDTPTDDATEALFPLMSAGSRKYWDVAGFAEQGAGDITDADVAFDVRGMSPTTAAYFGTILSHLTGNSITKRWSVAFQSTARQVSTDAYKVDYKVLNASPTSITAQAFRYDVAGDVAEPLSDATSLSTALGRRTVALDNPVERTLIEGEILTIRVAVAFAAAPDSSVVHLRAGLAQRFEGRDVRP